MFIVKNPTEHTQLITQKTNKLCKFRRDWTVKLLKCESCFRTTANCYFFLSYLINYLTTKIFDLSDSKYLATSLTLLFMTYKIIIDLITRAKLLMSKTSTIPYLSLSLFL